MLCFIATKLFAQEPVAIKLHEQDGLPDKEFYTVIEDTKQFLWFCADKGLFRYNGSNFKKYTNKDQLSFSVFGVKSDFNNKIWCNNVKGQFFYVQDNELILFKDFSELLKGELVDFIVTKNNLWIFSTRKIYQVSLKSKKIKVIDEYKHNLGKPCLFKNSIYYIKGNSLIKIDLSNFSVIPVSYYRPKMNHKEIHFSGKPVITTITDTSVLIRELVNNKNHFYTINTTNGLAKKCISFKKIENHIIQHVYNIDNTLWFSTTNGIWIYELINKKYQLKNHIFLNKNCSNVYKDKTGIIWITTLDDGVFFLPNIEINFYNLPELSNNISTMDVLNDTSLICGSKNATLSIVNTKSKQIRTKKFDNQSRVSFVKADTINNLIHVSTDIQGYVLNTKTFKSKKIENLGSAKSIEIINKDTLLVLTHNSLVRLNFKNQLFKKNPFYKRPYTSHKSKNKNYYVGFVDGLEYFDNTWKATSINYKNKPIYTHTIDETENGSIWCGSFKNGVYKIKHGKAIQNLTTKEGLVSNNIEYIKADGYLLWIATDKGIQVYNVKSKQYQLLTKQDGILSYNITGITIINNVVYFASDKGLFSISKKGLNKTYNLPELYFTEVIVNNTNYEIQNNYNWSSDQRSVSFKFNLNSFQFNKYGEYQYRLKGLDSNWKNIPAYQNTVSYNSLEAGRYQFQIQPKLAKNLLGPIQTISFVIAAPFWQAWWFYIILSLLAISLVVLYFKLNAKRKETTRLKQIQQLSIDKQLIGLKLESLRSQMNPHFIFNALNSIQDYILKNEKKLARNYLVKFSKLIRLFLEHSQKDYITLKEELNGLNLYLALEKDRFENTFEYIINVDNHIKTQQVLIPTFLVQPYIENAIKHGLLHKKHNRKISIIIKTNTLENMLHICIEDNGVGRKTSEDINRNKPYKPKSFSTQANNTRIALINKTRRLPIKLKTTDLVNKNNKALGTRVDVYIPLDT